MLTSSDCEGGGEVFRVCADSDLQGEPATAEGSKTRHNAFWSGSPAYLTVSSQLHLEALSLALSRVWTMTSAFRAEHSATNRHLAEFRMCEAELTCSPDLQVVLNCVQGVVQASVRAALLDEDGRLLSDVGLLHGQAEHTAKLHSFCSDRAWPRITYTDARQQIEEQFGPSASPKWGDSLSSEHERWLASEIGQGPLFVTDYPASIKPFYMRTSSTPAGESPTASQDRSTVACFDLLIPELGELAGGSLREDRWEILQQQLEAKAMQGHASHLQWYNDDLRRYGGMSHGGFGIGMERLVSWVTATDNVRDCIAFPRTHGPVRF